MPPRRAHAPLCPAALRSQGAAGDGPLEFGFLPRQVVADLRDLGNWKVRDGWVLLNGPKGLSDCMRMPRQLHDGRTA